MVALSSDPMTAAKQIMQLARTPSGWTWMQALAKSLLTTPRPSGLPQNLFDLITFLNRPWSAVGTDGTPIGFLKKHLPWTIGGLTRSD